MENRNWSSHTTRLNDTPVEVIYKNTKKRKKKIKKYRKELSSSYQSLVQLNELGELRELNLFLDTSYTENKKLRKDIKRLKYGNLDTEQMELLVKRNEDSNYEFLHVKRAMESLRVPSISAKSA